METMSALQQLGLLDLAPHPALHPNGPEITWVSHLLLPWYKGNGFIFLRPRKASLISDTFQFDYIAKKSNCVDDIFWFASVNLK